MMSHITCGRFAEHLADLMEDDVTADQRATLESHALACAECGSLLADLRQLRTDAANLPELAPSRDLWSGIAARIDAPVIPMDGRRAVRGGREGPKWRTWVPAALAAAALVAITAGITYYTTMHSLGTGTPRQVAAVTDAPTATVGAESTAGASTAPDGVPVSSQATTPATAPDRSGAAGTRPGARARLASSSPSESEETAEATYGREIARLRTIVEQRRTQLDPVTIGVIEHNLKIIDGAIAQCRAALAKDPASRFLIQSLNSALENKVELLRTAAMLPSRT